MEWSPPAWSTTPNCRSVGFTVSDCRRALKLCQQPTGEDTHFLVVVLESALRDGSHGLCGGRIAEHVGDLPQPARVPLVTLPTYNSQSRG
jgi:hypothetical protein